MNKELRSFFLYVLFVVLGLFSGQAQDFMPERYKSLAFDGFARAFRFSPDGLHAGVTTGVNGIHLLDAAFAESWNYSGNAENYGGMVGFSKDGTCLIFSKYQSNSDLAIYSIAEQKVVQAIKSQKYGIMDFELSPNGKLLASAGDSRELKIYALANKRLRLINSLSVDSPDFQFLDCVRFSPDGKFLATAGTGTDIFFFSVSDTIVKPLQTEEFRYWTHSLTFSNDSKYLFSASSDSIYIWALKGTSFAKVGTIECFGGTTPCLRFDPSGKFLLASKENATIYIYSWENGRLTLYNELEAHTKCVFDIDFSNDGLFMSTASLDNSVILWKLGDLTAWEQRVGATKHKGIAVNHPSDTSTQNVNSTGRNLLLVIGINDYTYWPKLNNGVGDASAVKSVLSSKYGFAEADCKELMNQQVTKKNILDQLSAIQQSSSSNDNLVIYYSGHGYYNSQIDEGYWIPVDARKGEETDYLPNSTLIKYIKSINCKHIFLVVDACFSGSLFSDGHKGYVEKVGQFRSRWCLSSGRLELVSDGKVGDHSPFATYFLKFLNENSKAEFPVSELIQYVKIAVSNNTEQTPIGNPLKNVGDEGGEFIFRLK